VLARAQDRRASSTRNVLWKRDTMRIDHIALWAKNIDNLKLFYEKYFHAKSNSKYTNPKNQFSSYFLSFDSDTRLEIMQVPSVSASKGNPYDQYTGYIHLAFSVGSEDNVDALTSTLADDGFEVLDGPRETGDGYYESVVLDPENNRIEITV
jgi:lactoylglutathione lyase